MITSNFDIITGSINAEIYMLLVFSEADRLGLIEHRIYLDYIKEKANDFIEELNLNENIE